MELLISQILEDGVSILERFKFQYGATNIMRYCCKVLKEYGFKFQYGATNIFSNVNTAGRINAFKFQYGATNM